MATFGDALRRLTDRATYLYVDGKRYWYSTQPTVARLAEDRAGQLNAHDVNEEIIVRLRKEANSRAEFSKVHACAPSGDIPDDREARLVILGPEFAHANKDAASAARKEAAAILESRGTSPRNYKNTLVFLAPDATRLAELQLGVRQYLAWKSIWSEQETLNLDQFQTKQAETKFRGADETVRARIPETYQWLIVPSQPDPKGAVEWIDIRLQGQDSLATRAAKKMRNEELLMVQLGGVRLRHELDRIPLWRGDHVGLKQLAEDMAKYLYLPRLRDEDVLLGAVRDGVSLLTWQRETFAYAEGWDETRKRYKGLQAGQPVRVLMESQTLLVKSEVAARQLDAERQQVAPPQTGGGMPNVADASGTGTTGQAAETSGVSGSLPFPTAPTVGRFHGAVRLDALRLGRDASRIAEEVVQHLSGIVGANVEVTLEIRAELPDGVSDKVVRDVTENCRTLKFNDYGFEET